RRYNMDRIDTGQVTTKKLCSMKISTLSRRTALTVALAFAGAAPLAAQAPTRAGTGTSSREEKPAKGNETHEPSLMFDLVVTVWSEFGHGTGFIVDQKGLILTNERVIGPSKIITVQFDPHNKVRATLLVADNEKHIS